MSDEIAMDLCRSYVAFMRFNYRRGLEPHELDAARREAFMSGWYACQQQATKATAQQLAEAPAFKMRKDD